LNSDTPKQEKRDKPPLGQKKVVLPSKYDGTIYELSQMVQWLKSENSYWSNEQCFDYALKVMQTQAQQQLAMQLYLIQDELKSYHRPKRDLPYGRIY
jgi:hypothetical protein